MTPFLASGAIFGIWNWTDAIIRILIIVLVMTVVVVYLTYGERKVIARFQQRLGPTRTGPAGLLQGLADALKLVAKEDLRPATADRWVFEFAPYATFIPVLMVLVVLPFAEDWGVRNLALGMFFVFAVLGLNIVGMLMAGLGSGNKFALLGGIRAAAQMISYEIPLVLSLLSVAMIARTLDLNAIAAGQSFTPESGQHAPYVVLQPLAFLIFFTAMLSELHRAPFDIPVAESEIVGGYFVEYSGIRWSMFQLTEYASMWAWSVFGSVVFLGGWAVPDTHTWAGPDWAWQLGITLIKSLAWIIAIMWIRVTVPRLRIDQLMSFCWKVLLPLALAQLLANGFILEYDGPDILLTLTSALGAVALLALIIFRAVKRPKSKLVGTYRQVQVSTP
ncbi:MAG: NADH-quinone oxidoreductase subunit NuoH [Chloroflexi bacterium]|nr:NADH-quinone oxidoreductase subunit NuoH [Chloroflexota bacterium]